MNTSVVVTFAVYLVAMLAVGLYFYQRSNSMAGYILGGRQLNKWVAALSAQASDMSGWLLLGLPGYAYLAGVESLWIAIGLAAGTYLNWRLVAQRLRRYTEQAGDAITLPDYFANRFGGEAPILRTLAAVFILIFFLIYTASGFVAGAKLFVSVFGVPYHVALLAGAIVIISYTFLGGFMAVSWTDFFQGSIMFLALVILPTLGIAHAGGWSTTLQKVGAVNIDLLTMGADAKGSALSVTTVVSLLAWGLGYFGQPHILARFMAIRDPKAVPAARLVAVIWVVICLAAAVVVGLVGHACLTEPLGETEAETVFFQLVDTLAHPLVGGILLAAVLAAIMSTADSQLLVSASALAEDIYHVWCRPQAGQKELVWVSRGTVIVTAVLAGIIASDQESSVLKLVANAWAGFGATFGPLILMSLFWRRMTRRGAMAGMLGGGITVLLWLWLQSHDKLPAALDVYAMVPGFTVSILAIVVVSLVDSPPPVHVTDTFDAVA